MDFRIIGLQLDGELQLHSAFVALPCSEIRLAEGLAHQRVVQPRRGAPLVQLGDKGIEIGERRSTSRSVSSAWARPAACGSQLTIAPQAASTAAAVSFCPAQASASLR